MAADLKWLDGMLNAWIQGSQMIQKHDDARSSQAGAPRLDGFFHAAFAFAVSLRAIAGIGIPHTLHGLTLARPA